MASDTALPPPPLGLRHWPTWAAIGLLVLLARLPWSLQRALGRALGAILRMSLQGRRRIAARNIELCFPQLDQRARESLVIEHFSALGIGVFEFARAWWGSIEPLRHSVQLEGLEHLQAAHAAGKGVILVSGHFTTLEICGRLLSEHLPVAGMYRPHAQPAMEWAVKRGRMRYAAAMFSKLELRPAVKHLKRSGILWYAPDQDPSRGDAVYVAFFDRPAHSLTSTHQLARLSGAAVVAFTHRRRRDGGYSLKLSAPLAQFPSDDPTDDTARIMSAIADMARAAPAQYLWIHRRFKRQPGGESVYR
ncbi:MAG: LpxL/LpxP family Kdo(2)-lipid IV(A) lauroyl/palmitoleoyl acyltransferase [Lysobacter sp.]|nr:LpxL/LpxP family Kdo(2)-lipid IV(A) lauroyl/palmitoleoyl acyltransferase [Lysobacter sp.]